MEGWSKETGSPHPPVKLVALKKSSVLALWSQPRTSKSTHPTFQLQDRGGGQAGVSDSSLPILPLPARPELKGEGGEVTTLPFSDQPSLPHYSFL